MTENLEIAEGLAAVLERECETYSVWESIPALMSTLAMILSKQPEFDPKTSVAFVNSSLTRIFEAYSK